jgi:hypothetical protein
MGLISDVFIDGKGFWENELRLPDGTLVYALTVTSNPTPTAPSRPSQSEVDRKLLDFAKQRGGKVKQRDAEANEAMKVIGASYQQCLTAFRNLPSDLRFSKGKPKSNA